MAGKHRIFWPGAALPALMVCLITLAGMHLPGCASNPIAAANTLNQKAYATYGTFVIVEEQAAKLVSDPIVSGFIKDPIKAADARAKPSADALLKALQDYEAVQAAVKAGTGGTAEQLTIASAHLNQWIATATADVATLVIAVKNGS